MAKLSAAVNPLSSNTVLFLCIVALTHPSFSVSAPTQSTNDPVWRMVAGAKAAETYTSYEQIVTFNLEEALLSISGVHLRSVLEGVCDLVSVYELISKVDSGSDLHTLLTQNVVDSCTWLNHLISENADVTGSEVLSSLPDTCSPQSTPRLHEVCFQMKVRESDQLRHLVREDIYDKLTLYYPSCEASDETSCEWLESSPAIPEDTKERIQDNVDLDCE